MSGHSTRRELAAAGLAAGVAACVGAPRPTAARPDVLGDLDAVGLREAFRQGELTPIDAVEAAIARAERVNPALNFLATATFAEARAAAVRPGQGLFAGVPTLLKDLVPVAGVRCMFGSRAFREFVPQGQPPFVDAVFAAGFVSIGKSTTPEFGLSAGTEPLVTGPTRNPWRLDHSAGGSSGGAGAAVAAGVAPIAHGTDAAGSIRIPASCNGLVGLKPSRRRLIASWAEVERHSIAVDGCLSRTVRDTAAWLALLDRGGPLYPPLGLVTAPSTRRLRIAVAVNSASGGAPHSEVAAVLHQTAELCRSLGHVVSDAQALAGSEDLAPALTTYFGFVAAMLKGEAAHHGGDVEELLEPLTLDLAARFESAPDALDGAVAALREAEARYDAQFENVDLILTPTLPGLPPLIGELDPTRPDAFERVLEQIVYTAAQNVAGAPAISLPLFYGPSGLPIGSQFSARKGQEAILLELALELEAALPWIARKPPVWGADVTSEAAPL